MGLKEGHIHYTTWKTTHRICIDSEAQQSFESDRGYTKQIVYAADQAYTKQCGWLGMASIYATWHQAQIKPQVITLLALKKYSQVHKSTIGLNVSEVSALTSHPPGYLVSWLHDRLTVGGNYLEGS